MTFKMPARGYLTWRQLCDRWQCTDSELHDAVVTGDVKVAIHVDGWLSVPTWSRDGLEIVADDTLQNKNGEEVRVRYSGLLFLQRPKRTGLDDCEFRLGSNVARPSEPDDTGWLQYDFWYWLPEIMTVRDIISQGAFLMPEIRHFENLHSTSSIERRPEEKTLQPRERKALMNIIGAMLELLKSPRAGRDTDAAIIAELVKNYGDKHGISKSNLDRKLPEAKRSLTSD